MGPELEILEEVWSSTPKAILTSFILVSVRLHLALRDCEDTRPHCFISFDMEAIAQRGKKKKSFRDTRESRSKRPGF